MSERKVQHDLTVMEAVDHLSSLAELDTKSSKAPEEEGKINWVDSKNSEEKRETIRQTFRVINNYLHHLYEKDKGRLKDQETQRGVQSIMVLVGEAAQKLDKFTSLFKEAGVKDSVTNVKEYQDLQQYYLTKIVHRFQKTLENEEAWQAEWAGAEETGLDVQRRGLKDLETVRRDKEYELFYILRDDGRPFFNRNLLRHIKLVGDFDETLSDPSGEDPLLRIKTIQDRELQESARAILDQASPHLDEYFKNALKNKEMPIVAGINKAVMALMLTANPRNLIQNTTGKSCVGYFRDFHIYLRAALSSPEYQKLIATPFEELDRFSHSLLNIAYTLSLLFFTRQSTRTEAIELIKRLIGKKKKEDLEKGASFWNSLLDSDEEIRDKLKRYPNGPLLKTLDAFREGEEHGGFDPFLQENLPAQLFSFHYDSTHVSCLRLPSPTKQEVINKAHVVEEFASFVRSLNTRVEGKKHLLINIQDRTSWQEHARSLALEELQRKAEFASNLCVVTLPKSTEFYLQSETYYDLDQAEYFLAVLKEQVASGEECGFFFPAAFKTPDFSRFVDQAIDLIHHQFFSGKKELLRKERLDFIEIFYQLLILKIVDIFRPDSMSLTCKDAVDTGAAASASLYAFLRILSNPSPWTQEERDLLLWMFFAPSLFLRERAIDLQRLHRSVSALATVQVQADTQRNKLLAALNPLYSTPIFMLLALT
jgi:hypothetical protein